MAKTKEQKPEPEETKQEHPDEGLVVPDDAIISSVPKEVTLTVGGRPVIKVIGGRNGAKAK